MKYLCQLMNGKTPSEQVAANTAINTTCIRAHPLPFTCPFGSCIHCCTGHSKGALAGPDLVGGGGGGGGGCSCMLLPSGLRLAPVTPTAMDFRDRVGRIVTHTNAIQVSTATRTLSLQERKKQWCLLQNTQTTCCAITTRTFDYELVSFCNGYLAHSLLSNTNNLQRGVRSMVE